MILTSMIIPLNGGAESVSTRWSRIDSRSLTRRMDAIAADISQRRTIPFALRCPWRVFLILPHCEDHHGDLAQSRGEAPYARVACRVPKSAS